MQRKAHDQRKDKYSHQFLIVCGATCPNYHLLEAYTGKWKEKHHDPQLEHLHIIYLAKDDKIDDEKFNILELADNRSRITILGHHHTNEETISVAKNQGSHYTKIVDVIAYNVKHKSILMNKDEHIEYTERCLKITILACHSAKPNDIKNSLAHKFFDYACNHHTHPLKIELTAPTSLVIPLPLAPTVSGISLFSIQTLVKESNQKGFHKRYGDAPIRGNIGGFFSRIFSQLGPFSYFWPKYKPDGYKIVFKISPESCFGEIKPKTFTPAEDKEHYALQEIHETFSCSDAQLPKFGGSH